MSDDGADLIGHMLVFEPDDGSSLIIWARATTRDGQPSLIVQWHDAQDPHGVEVTTVRRWLKEKALVDTRPADER